MKIRPVGAELFLVEKRTVRETDRQTGNFANDKSNELETKCKNRIAQSYVEAYRVIT